VSAAQWSARPGAEWSSVGSQWSAGPGADGWSSDETPSISDEFEKFVSDPIAQLEQLHEETEGGLGKPGLMLDEEQVGQLQELLGPDGDAAGDDDAEPLAGGHTCPPSDTKINKSPPNTTEFSGATPQEIQDQALRLASASPGHIDRPLTDNLCTKANQAETVETAVVAVNITLSLPVWSSAARGKATPKDKPIIEKYFKLVEGHEAKHEAITRKHFANAHKALIGRQPSRQTKPKRRLTRSSAPKQRNKKRLTRRKAASASPRTSRT
jgi:hypothetical protein